MDHMFDRCESLTSLDISNFNTTNVQNMTYMFRAVPSLKYLNISSFTNQNLKNSTGMFDSCRDLEILDMSSFNDFNVGGENIFQYISSTSGTIYVNNNFKNYAEKNLPQGWEIKITNSK